MKKTHILTIALAVFALGYWAGFWHGRTHEVNRSTKRLEAMAESINHKSTALNE